VSTLPLKAVSPPLTNSSPKQSFTDFAPEEKALLYPAPQPAAPPSAKTPSTPTLHPHSSPSLPIPPPPYDPIPCTFLYPPLQIQPQSLPPPSERF
jgi:hypothetical protein